MSQVACTVVPKRARHPATFLDMKRQLFKSLLQTARALTATTHRLIRQEAAEWRIALLQAWSEALRGTGEPVVFAALHAAYADGCELQGRHQEATAIRQAIAERRGVLLPLDDDLH